jgi:tetratricopeptide (TPR) repeat protein
MQQTYTKQYPIERFIGRAHELDIFQRWLVNEQSSQVLYFYDAAEEANKKGGVGKTYLIRKCKELVEQEFPDKHAIIVDMFNVASRNNITVAEHIIAGLQELHPEWAPTAFQNALQQYRSEGISPAEVADSTDIAEIRTRDILTTALLEDIQRLEKSLVDSSKTLVVFFDTYEIIERNPAIAVLRLSQRFPDTYHLKHIRFVVAGRNMLDWTHQNWRGRENEVRSVPLSPFTRQETQYYLEQESIYSVPTQSPQALQLYEITEGRPILLGLVADILNNHVLTLDELVCVPKDEFEQYLVMKINMLQNPQNWVVLFMAHAYHRFTFDILEWLLTEADLKKLVGGEVKLQELRETLPRLSFVRQTGSGDTFVLHDEMQRLVTKYCWSAQDPDQRYRKAISRSMIRYYERLLGQKLDEQAQQVYTIEMLYHRLSADLDEGMDYFQRQFNRATRLIKSAFARLLQQEAQKFSDSATPTQQNVLQLAEARLLRLENNPTAALSMLATIEQNANPHWLENNRSFLVFERGRNYYQLNRFDEAAESFRQSLHIAQERGNQDRAAHALSFLGGLYRSRGQLDTAIRYYEESAAIYKETGAQLNYADLLSSLGTTYRYKGKIEEALRRHKIAWRIRLQALREGRGTDLQVGMSLSNIGRIYLNIGEIVSAEKFFREAFDIYNRANYKRGLANIYIRLGQIEMQRDNLDRAWQLFQEAEATATEVDSESLIESLNMQGRLKARLQRWDEAKAHFEQASELAQQIRNDYQWTDNLIYLADALERLGQQEQAEQAWRQAEKLALREDHYYYYLLGKGERAKAEFSYSKREYARAFDHFARYCHYMAQHNPVEFNTAIRATLDALYGVPKDQVAPLVDILSSYWKTNQLNEEYPELPEAVEEADELLMI